MERLTTDSKVYVLETMLFLGICFFIMQAQTTMVSVLFHVTFFLLVLIFILQIAVKPVLNGLHVLTIITIVLTFIHVTIQADEISFAYYKKLIMFSCTLMMLPIVNGMYVNKKLVDWVIGVNLFTALLYIVMYWGLNVRTQNDVYLTMNFRNSNTTGMFIVHSMLYCAIAFYRFRHWVVRGILIAMFAALYYLLDKTGTRSAILALFGFGGLTAYNVVLKKEVKISPALSLLLVISPLIIAYIYLFMANNDLLERWFSSFVSRGKTLDAREAIWERALRYYQESPIIGAYSDASGGRGMSQMHNTHIDVLVSYGLVPFVMFIAILHKGLLGILDEARSEFGHMCVFAFYAVLFQGTFEAALVSGGTGLYILSFGFLLLAKYNENDEIEEEPFMPMYNQRLYRTGRF